MCVGLSGMWLGVDGAYRSRCERKVSFETRPKTMDERCIMEWGFLVGSTASDVQCHRSVEVAAAVEAVLLKPTGAMRDLQREAWGLDIAGSCCRRSTCTCTCITDVLASRLQLHIRMTVRHSSTCICVCSVEATQDLGPKGQVGEEGRCRVRTKSFGWRARWDVPL